MEVDIYSTPTFILLYPTLSKGVYYMRDPKIEAWLNKLLVNFEYVKSVKISDINFSENSRNAKQVRFDLIDASTYDNMLKSRDHGDEMPAVLLNQVGDELYMLDGNHRLQTAIDSNLTTHDAYVVSVEPDSTVELQLMLEPNTKLASKALTNEERTRWAIFLSENSKLKQSEIAEVTGMSSSQVSNALRFHRAYIRASRLLARDRQLQNSWDKLAPSYQMALDRISSDIGWKAAVTAVVEYKLTSGQITAMVNTVRNARSDEAHVKAVEAFIEDLRSNKNVKRNNTEKRAWEYIKMHAAAIKGVDVKRIERELMTTTLDDRQYASLVECLEEAQAVTNRALEVITTQKKNSTKLVRQSARRAAAGRNNKR